MRAGEPSIFLRFSGCNMRCDAEPGPGSPGGFACDTEFASGRNLCFAEIIEWIERLTKKCKWIVLTGGEPGLQVDKEMVALFHADGYKLAIETNGSINLNGLGLDWITVSPKVAEHCIKQRVADEVKYVRAWGQGIPETVVTARHYLISPAFDGSRLDSEMLKWCTQLCLDNPNWRLSVQQHKGCKVR